MTIGKFVTPPHDDEFSDRIGLSVAGDLTDLFESMQIETIVLDGQLRVVKFAPAAPRLLTVGPAALGQPLSGIEAHIPIAELYDHIDRVARTRTGVDRTLTVAASGKRYLARIVPYQDRAKTVAGVAIAFIDITAAAVTDERHRLLLAELQHRVRNTLSVIRSIALRSARSSATVEEYAAHLDGRFNAFARTLAMVARDPGSGIDLQYMVAEELAAYRAAEGEQVHITGPAIRLQPKAAEVLVLAVHELATNAVKYGALSRPAGRVAISWQIEGDDDRSLVMQWRESGGPPVEPPQRSGFGTELLQRTLAFEFDAKVDLGYEPDGFRCRIALPITPRLVLTTQGPRS